MDEIHCLKNHSKLLWVKDTDRLMPDRETIKTNTVKIYKGIYFCFYDQKLEILFKPHYYFNNDLHNANDFTVADFLAILFELKAELGFDYSKMRVMNIEFGVNVLSPINVKDLVNHIKYHVKNPFINHNGLRYSKFASSCNRYGKLNLFKIIKAYAKGSQYPKYIEPDTFRFEIKSNRTAYIKKHLKVNTMEDLLTKEVYALMAKHILKEFNAVLILDPYAKPQLSIRERKILSELLNPDTWYHISNSENRNKFSRKRRKYLELIGREDENLKAVLTQRIKSKLELLLKGI